VASLALPQLTEGYLATVNQLGNGHFKVGIINPYGGVDVRAIPLTLRAKYASSLNEVTFSQIFLNDVPSAGVSLKNVTTDIEPPAAKSAQPVSYDLIGAYPNPFNPTTRIVFQTAASAQVHLDLYNAGGTRIKALLLEHMGPGRHEVSWDGTNDLGQAVATGQYFCVMRAGSFVKTIHLLLLK